MSRFQHLLCFTIILATVTFFNVASAHVKIKPALPQSGDPIIIGDIEPYTVKVVSTFVADLEKECAKTEKFRYFFEKINAFSKYVCSVSKGKDHESHMKAKAGSLFQAIAALGTDESVSKGGEVNKLQKEKTEAMETVKMLQSIGEKITGGRNNKTEINEILQLTKKQQKEIKDGILKWLNVISLIAEKADEISMKSSSKSETKEEKSVEPRKLVATKSSTKSNKNSDKESDNKKKESDNKKNKKGESKKKKNGGKEGRHGSAKSKGGSDDDKSSKNKRKSSENADKNHRTKYGTVETKKGGVEQSRNKTAERLRAEAADELD